MTEKKDVEGFLEAWEDEVKRQKAIEAAKKKENEKPEQPVKKKPLPTHSLPTYIPTQRQRVQVVPLSTSEIRRITPKEKQREPVSIYGPPLPKIPIPRGKGLR